MDDPSLTTGGNMSLTSGERVDAIPSSEPASKMEEPPVGSKEMETPTCRICRGEETPEEPLFYPCKCNGSIRFVHQACLMEWLSRSQKRHCELCKTPFRFTKLYDPRMPSTVPFPIFLMQAILQVGRAVMRVFRYVLVAFVWLCWVPWTMRTMWRFLFWLGDGAWIDYRELAVPEVLGSSASNSTNATLATSAYRTLLGEGPASAVTANSSMELSTAESWFAAIHDVILRGVTFTITWDPSRAQPLMVRIGRRLMRDSLSLAGIPSATSTGPNSTLLVPDLSREGTILSDVKYLQNITKWPALNRTIIDILEGQLITLFVLVLIILVFLIREWVVQQQPNLGLPRGPAPELAIDAPPAPLRPVINDEAPAVQPLEVENAVETRPAQDPTPAVAERFHNVTAPSRVMPDAQNGLDNISEEAGQEANLTEGIHVPSASTQSTALDSSQSPRPSMPRHALEPASKLHRVLFEERSNFTGDKWLGVQIFMDYWNRGHCDPQQVLDLIRAEGREEELEWIVRALNRLDATDFMGDVESEGLEGASEDPNQSAKDENSGTGDSWQVLDENHNELPAVGPFHRPTESGPSSVPTWLESSNVAWPRENEDLGSVKTDPLSNRAERGSSPSVAGSEQAALIEHPTTHTPNEDEPFEGFAGGPESDTAPVDLDNGVGIDPVQDPAPAPAAAPVENGAPAASFWDQVANLLWGHVDLPRDEQQMLANQLQPILQPEAEHEAPLPAPPAAQAAMPAMPQAPVQIPGPVPPAALPAAQAPNVNLPVGPQPLQDPEVLRAAQEAGVDPEDVQAVEEGEDLDGLVELIGLQGPLLALIQHGMVCGALVTLVVFFGIWVPYISGKVVLVLLSNPVTLLIKLPLRWTSFIVNVVIDTAIFIAGMAFFWLDTVLRTLVRPIGWVLPLFTSLQQDTLIPDAAVAYAHKSIERLAKTFTVDESFADSDIPFFSVIAHESLVRLEEQAYNASLVSYTWLETLLETPWTFDRLFQAAFYNIRYAPTFAWNWLKWDLNLIRRVISMIPVLARTNPFKVRLEFPERTEPFNLDLIQWNARDRVFAIVLGYLAFYAIGAAYINMRRAMRNSTAVRDEALEILSQAGGVLKVILIISIEMIAFPLYCGLLLDIAMLPLFKDRSLLTRLTFAAENPLTSMFLHWFVGTCYMFHFALFVSMCRKAMRSGVLYFIRDPDDPTFHPVRDVLERNLVGQLRKILFSALVYGALVIVCLGAVVWAVAASPIKVLPIKWSSLSSSFELPIDLIVLNFLIPVAIKVLDPSQGLEIMYKWWFRRCARFLRLSHFLFDDQRKDEQGHWVDEKMHDGNKPISRISDGLQTPDHQLERWHESAQDTQTENVAAQARVSAAKEHDGVRDGKIFVREGRFVRAPASDQVRIPRSHRTFLDVDENDNVLEGNTEPEEGKLHAKSNKLFRKVWLPPYFQLRIAIFVILVWIFAAVTGLGVTIVPLCFGRYVFDNYLPPDAPVNDVHAFCFGAYVIGGPIFLVLKHQTKAIKAYKSAKTWVTTSMANYERPRIARKILATYSRALRVLYFYTGFGVVLPTLLATVFDFYVFVPLSTRSAGDVALGDRLVKISFIQNWTVGVLYLRIIGRFIHSNQDSRPARALFALVAPTNNGASWWDPDVKLATRAFFLPSLVIIGAALGAPLLLGYTANTLWFKTASPIVHTAVYRYSYPALAACVLLAFAVGGALNAFRRWRSRIRDEVYLIGERLHNFGERRPAVTNRVVPS